MQAEISSLTQQTSAALKAANVSMALGHVYELVATAFGYRSRAAFLLSGAEPTSITNCEYLAVDVQAVTARAIALGYAARDAEQFLAAFSGAVTGVKDGPKVVITESDLLDDLWEEVNTAVYEDEGVASEAATTNGSYDEVEAWTDDPANHPTQASDSWSCPITGVLHIDQDPERPWSGDEVSFDGSLVFTKCGQAGLNFDRVEIDSASVVWDEPESAE
jgi:hypothetical protein